ncbi:MAG TPA: serine/threonine-protein kinase [Gemmatimonadales bacterium]|nr:serine/threonine-protein kinase [Gemmatimonadales bacterium]
MPLADAPAPGTQLGQLTLERLLGQGGFASVWAAQRPDGQRVAVKILKPRYAGDEAFELRFRQESQFAANLGHPRIIKIGEIGREGVFVYFTMDLYPASLATALAQGPLPEQQLIDITRDVTEALAFAHAQGVVHRDIKPDNILLGPDGRAVVSDFGIARAVSGYVSATGVNMTIGTPHYLSPEQAQGRPIDGRSDLYSLGITLYKAATGDLPFKSKDWYELARMHVEEPPAPPRIAHPELSRKLERIILRLLAKHPDDRPASAQELLAELEAMHDPGRDTRSFKVPDEYKQSVTSTIDAVKAPGKGEGKKWWKPW